MIVRVYEMFRQMIRNNSNISSSSTSSNNNTNTNISK